MAANTTQIFTGVPKASWCTITAANTAMDGTGTLDAAGTATTTTGHLGTLMTSAGANTAGSRGVRIRAKALGTNIASVARFFLNNGSTNATAANNSLIAELDLPATTASNTASLTLQELPTPNGAASTATQDTSIFPLIVPNGYKIMVGLGTAVSAGWQFTCDYGDY